MAILPRYRRVGVEAAAPQRIDYSPLAQEGARLGNAISSNVDRMSEFIYREQARRAEMAGQEAVREQGALPILQRLSEQGGPGISIAEQSAYEAANRLAVAEIEFEAEQQIAQILETAQRTGAGLSTVNAQLEDVTDGFAASLGYLNPVAAGELQLRLRATTARAGRTYASRVARGAGQGAATRRADRAINLAENITAMAQMEGVTPQEINDVVIAAGQSLADMGATGTQVERFMTEARRTAYDNRDIGIAMRSDPETFLSELEARQTVTEALPGYDLVDTFAQNARFEQYGRDRIRAFEVDASRTGAEIDAFADLYEFGAAPNPADLARVEADVERLSVFDPSLPERFTVVRQMGDFIQYMRALPGGSDAAQGIVDSLNATGMSGFGGAGIDTQTELNRVRVAAAIQEDMAADERDEIARLRIENAEEINLLGRTTDMINSALQSGDVGQLEVGLDIYRETFEALPEQLVDDDARRQFEAVTELGGSVLRWRDALPEERLAEYERLVGETLNRNDYESDSDLVQAVAVAQAQRSALGSLIAEEQRAVADGDLLEMARTREIQMANDQGDVATVGGPLDFSSPETFQATIDQRLREVGFLEARYQATGQNFLLNGEVEFLVRTMEAAPAGVAAQYLGMIAAQDQDVALRILNDMGEQGTEGRFYAHVGGLQVEGLGEIAGRAIAGSRILADPDLRPPATGQDQFDREVRGVIGNAFAGSPGTAGDIMNVTRALYAEAASRDLSLAEDPDRNIIPALVQESLGASTIERINGADVLIQLGVELDKVEDFLSSPNLNRFAGDAAITNRDQVPNANFDTLSVGDWYPVLTRSGYRMQTGDILNPVVWADETTGNVIYMDLAALSGMMRVRPVPNAVEGPAEPVDLTQEIPVSP